MKIMGILLKEWFKAFILAIIIVIILFYLIWPMRIEGSSMEDSLHDGDYILVSRIAYFFKPYERNDIIVAKINHNNKKEKIVKRIIAVEGDHLVIKDGKVKVNSDYEQDNLFIKGVTEGDIDIFIPKDSYFLLGDNRNISKDSRYFGCINKKDVIGKVLINFSNILRKL